MDANKIEQNTSNDGPLEVTSRSNNGGGDEPRYRGEPYLQTIPVEIFLNICSFLDASYISETLSKVCRRFEDIFTDRLLWKYWVSRRLKHKYPALLHVDTAKFNWEDACIKLDNEYKRWSASGTTMRHIVVSDVHFASVDTILLVNNGELCVSGGRDRGLALWKISEITSERYGTRPAQMKADAHAGWVWDLATNDANAANIVYSASWDYTVKAWDLATALGNVQTFKCGMTALSVISDENMVMAGLYSPKVLIFDPRVGPTSVKEYIAHRGPVLVLESHDNFVVSASEDRTLAVWDKRMGCLTQRDIRLPNRYHAYPVSLKWENSSLYAGDSKGTLHLLDVNNFKTVGTYELWPQPVSTVPASKVTAIAHSVGGLICCSDRGEIKFLFPSDPPQEFHMLQSATVDITELQYQNNILAISTCDSALEFWVPVEKMRDLIAV